MAGNLLWSMFDSLFAPLDRRQAGRLTASLHRRIDERWANLLAHHSGTVIDKPQPGGRTHFDYASCLVRFPRIEMLVSEGRGEVRVQVRSLPEGMWEELSLILNGANSKAPLPTDGLAAFETAIVRNWPQIEDSAAWSHQ